MIERLTDDNIKLDTANSIEGRIKAYLRAYGTGYDFCRFYKGDDLVVMDYDSELFISAKNGCDYDELCSFLRFNGFSSAVVSENCISHIENNFNVRTEKLYGVRKKNNGNLTVTDNRSTDYKAVYGIISDAFGLSEDGFDHWYADICHRVRHNVSRIIKLSDMAGCTVIYDDDICFLSHISVRKEYQGQGIGRRLLDIAMLDTENDLILDCKEDRLPFYKKCGFEITNVKYQIVKE